MHGSMMRGRDCRCTIVLHLVQPADQTRGSSARKCAYYCNSSVVSAGDFGRSLFPCVHSSMFLHGTWVFAVVYFLMVPHIYENLSASRMWSTYSQLGFVWWCEKTKTNKASVNVCFMRVSYTLNRVPHK